MRKTDVINYVFSDEELKAANKAMKVANVNIFYTVLLLSLSLLFFVEINNYVLGMIVFVVLFTAYSVFIEGRNYERKYMVLEINIDLITKEVIIKTETNSYSLLIDNIRIEKYDDEGTFLISNNKEEYKNSFYLFAKDSSLQNFLNMLPVQR